MKFLITSGGTRIPIDLVRSISNMSKGTFGSKIADAAIIREHQVTYFHAKNSKLPRISSEEFLTNKHFSSYKPIVYDTFADYAVGLPSLIHQDKPDCIILAAAVSDYTVAEPVHGKIRSKEDMTIQLVKTPKIIAKVRSWAPNAVICGFKLLVNSTKSELMLESTKSLIENRCDLVIGNDLSDIKANQRQLLVTQWGQNVSGQTIEFSTHTQNLPDVVVEACQNIFDKKAYRA